MTCEGAAALALSPCPALDGRRRTLSLPWQEKKDGDDRGGGNEPQCSPNPPKWNWQARWSNCSQHYFLWQEILLSTNRGFNKLQEMRLSAVVKRLRLSSTVEVAVSPDALSLPHPPPPLSLCPAHTFSSPSHSLLLLSHFTSNYLITCYTNTTSFSHFPIAALASFLQGLFFDHFLLLTVFVSLKGKTLLPCTQQVPSLVSSDCFFAASVVV